MRNPIRPVTFVSLGFAEEPLEGEEVTETAGTQIFVAREVAGPLADSLIDVTDTAEGPQLVIRPREAGA